jgi:hypothetical protein
MKPEHGQRLPTRLTGPPRFIGVPGRTPTPGAPTPGVTTARATGRGRSTTPGLTTHPTGYATYWQYTTALAVQCLRPRIRLSAARIARSKASFYVLCSEPRSGCCASHILLHARAMPRQSRLLAIVSLIYCPKGQYGAARTEAVFQRSFRATFRRSLSGTP